MFEDCENKQPISSICVHFGDGDWIESKDQSEEGIRLIQTGNVGDGVFKNKEEKARYISEETFARLNCTEVLPGDILISRLPDPICRSCIIPEVQKAITAVDCTIVRLGEKILPEFFVGFTKTDMYSEQIATHTTGTTRKRISRANLGKVKIPVPEISMQEEFVFIAKQSDKSKFIELFSKTEKGVLSDVAMITMGQSPDGKTYYSTSNFNCIEFEAIKNEAGDNSFVMTPKRWIESTGAISIISKRRLPEA